MTDEGSRPVLSGLPFLSQNKKRLKPEGGVPTVPFAFFVRCNFHTLPIADSRVPFAGWANIL